MTGSPLATPHDSTGRMARADASGLCEGDLELLGRIRWSSNATFLGRLLRSGDAGDTPARDTTDAEEGILVVYKPRRGERPLWDFPPGTLCERERAAYELSEALGWSIVPPTVLRDGPHGHGMVQRFVDHDPQEHYLTLQPGHPERFAAFAAFDVIVNNADRKAGHCLRDRVGHIWGIDHGLAFHDEPKLRTVIWEYAGTTVPEALLADLACVLDQLAGDLGARLGAWLTEAELVALRSRCEDLVTAGVFPRPSSRHALPWPLI